MTQFDSTDPDAIAAKYGGSSSADDIAAKYGGSADGPTMSGYSSAPPNLDRRHPSQMTDDEIVKSLMNIDPAKWDKIKKSPRYREGQVRDLFTDPEGYWGSYIVGKNKDSLGSSLNKAVQSVAAGVNKANIAGRGLTGSLLSKVTGKDYDTWNEIEQKANEINQNLNQQRGRDQGGDDPANMVGQALMSAGISKGRVGGSLFNRAVGESTRAGAEAFVGTPGSPTERTKSAVAAGGTSLIPYVGTSLAKKYVNKSGAQKLLQRVFKVKDSEIALAAEREAAVANLNKTHGTNLKLSAGQASDNPWLRSSEQTSVYLPLGMKKAREVGNEETRKMFGSFKDKARSAAEGTEFRNLEDLLKAAANGDKDAARILRDYVSPSGTNSRQVIEASREVNLKPLKDRKNEAFSMFKKQGDELGPISMEGEAERLNPLVADLERVLGGEAAGAKTARAVSEDIGRAQGELFPSPQVKWETGAGRLVDDKPVGLYEGSPNVRVPGSIDEFLSGARGAETISSVPGSVNEFVNSAQRFHSPPRTTQNVFPQPNVPGVRNEAIPGFESGRWTFGGNTNPASGNTSLNAGNIQESIARLKQAAQAARESNPRLAGELDQIVTGMDTKFQTAVSRDPSTRAALDAANAENAAFTHVRDADTVKNYTGPSGEKIELPGAYALEDKGLATARSLSVDEAFAAGVPGGTGSLRGFKNQEAAKSLGDPVLDQYWAGASAEERKQILDILNATADNSPATNSINMPTFLKSALGKVGAYGGGFLLGGAPGALVGGAMGPAARGLFNTPTGKRLLLERPEFRSSLPPDWLSGLIRSYGISEGQE